MRCQYRGEQHISLLNLFKKIQLKITDTNALGLIIKASDEISKNAKN